MAEEAVYDYGEYVDQPQGEGDLAVLSNLAEQGRHHQEEVERLQRELKKAQEALKDVVEFKIPEIMDRVGMEKFSTRNGLDIAIKEAIRASIGTGATKEGNLDWLQEQGHEAVIKMGVEVKFGRSLSDQTKAKELVAKLRDELGLPAEFIRKVEPATLSALIKELLEQGADVPEDKFGVFRQRIAKIS